MSFTAKDVAALRAQTGAGMMDCKKALEATGGDVAQAVEWLRKKGMASAEKRADRSTSQGLVGQAVQGHRGVLVEVNCETDFVARTDAFKALVGKLVAQALVGPVTNDVAEFGAQAMAAEPGKTVTDVVKEAGGTIGEAIRVSKVAILDTVAGARFGSYLHHNAAVGVLVDMHCGSEAVAAHEEIATLGKALAEHVAATNPLAVDRTGVAADIVEREQRIAEEQAKASGKPEPIAVKIATGKVEAFFRDNTLVGQPWVREPGKTIAELIAETGKKAGGTVTVTRFVRFKLGEA
ncbi:MAG: translation elongation factor Ts [Gemmatimonadaceae bacterium]|jgi:elongation factor Ts|nr:translation elongation factor Ts [Gemmatimonadaceae bacterium]